MGLTRTSVGVETITEIKNISKTNNQKIVALIGNPNVGKSSIFNTLTGMHQHTGNWPGKTVKIAIGSRKYNNTEYVFVDLPGCYSLSPNSPEEIVSRDFIYTQKSDVTVVVCDATSLERNLNLVLQIKEITDNVIVCLNLMDEAHKKKIHIDINKLSKLLRCPVIGTVAHKKEKVLRLIEVIESYVKEPDDDFEPLITYPEHIEKILSTLMSEQETKKSKSRADFLQALTINSINLPLEEHNLILDDISKTISEKAHIISKECVHKYSKNNDADLKIDKILTGKIFGFASMLLLLFFIFWITISGANYPSNLLSSLFTSLEEPLYSFLKHIKIPVIVCEMLVYGVYHILTWIVSVMLPPMAIFFPLFTLLEDVGYLPRIAFNLDKCFKNCSACGKQALTMCMGFGCNSAGVVGCRIINSPRERLIAILTNSFVPCNGRFPAIIALITMFFVSGTGTFLQNFMSALYLSLFILLGISATLFASKLLSKTFLKGIPSTFTLELPPYRKPQISKIIVHSIFDRTLFVLYRAIIIAAPAGLLIWLLANIQINNLAILSYISAFFDPIGKMMGLDGIIITAFILGFPANEIVLPLIIMMYLQNGILYDISNLSDIRNILITNGWTNVTAINTIIFMLFHWPCSTTCLTIRSETKSWKWTLLSIALPSLFGVLLCIAINIIF